MDQRELRDTILRERKAIYRDVQRALDYPEEFPGIEDSQVVHGLVVGTLRAVLERRDHTTFEVAG